VFRVPLTSNLRWADAPGKLALPRMTGLSKDSVANVSQIVAFEKSQLTERVGKIPRAKFQLLLADIDILCSEDKI
jgi:mRNA interferase MazF